MLWEHLFVLTLWNMYVCGEGGGSFKWSKHPQECRKYGLRRSVSFPQGTRVTYITWDVPLRELRAASNALGTICPRHHTDKSLPSVYGTNLGRENWGAGSGLKVEAIEHDEGQRGGPSRSVTNILQQCARWKGFRGRHAPSGMSSDPQRRGEVRWLIRSNSIHYPSTKGLLVSRKTFLMRIIAHKVLVWFPPQGSPVDVYVQCSHWAHTIKLFLVGIPKGRWMECLQDNWPWNYRGYLGDISRPRVQKNSGHARCKFEAWWGHWKGLNVADSLQWGNV